MSFLTNLIKYRTAAIATGAYVGVGIQTDENGNLIANVSHRKGAIADLLAITNAGDGEIAVATDVNAIVVYRGISPSVGKAYYMDKEVARAVASSSTTSIVTATETTLKLTAVTHDPNSLLDVVNEWVVLPATGFNSIEVQVSLGFISGDGTYRRIFLEVENTFGMADWGALDYADVVFPNVSDVTSSINATFKHYESTLPIAGLRVRVRFVHDKTTNISALGVITVILRND